MKKTVIEKDIQGPLPLACVDHLVTKETFKIIPYQNGILKTEPVPENLDKYYESENYISHRDSSKSLQDRIYQFVKSYMLSQKVKWIRREIQQGSILDFGAGTGEFLNKMNSYYWNVEGVEPNEVARELAIFKGLDLKTSIKEVNRKTYDVISLWHVLEHLPDFENKLGEFYNLLEPGGILIIAVPNYNSYEANYYKQDWAAWDVPRHLWHFSRNGIKNILSEIGFSLLKEKPLKFDSYYVSLLSEQNAVERSNPLNAILRGAISNFKAKSSGEYSSIAYFFQKTE